MSESKTLCVNGCGRPRTRTRLGRLLTKCAICQQAYWNDRARMRSAEMPDPSTLQECCHCHAVKPLSDFRRAGYRYDTACKVCAAAQTALPTTETQVCTKCGEEKPLNAFYAATSTRRRATCMACGSQASKDRYAAQRSGTAPRPQPASAAKIVPLAQSLPRDGDAVLVNRGSGQIVVVKVLSEIPNGAKRLDNLIDAFRTKGLRILETQEK